MRQGWSLPVEGYPRLTEIAAWREGTRIGHDCDRSNEPKKKAGTCGPQVRRANPGNLDKESRKSGRYKQPRMTG